MEYYSSAPTGYHPLLGRWPANVTHFFGTASINYPNMCADTILICLRQGLGQRRWCGRKTAGVWRARKEDQTSIIPFESSLFRILSPNGAATTMTLDNSSADASHSLRWPSVYRVFVISLQSRLSRWITIDIAKTCRAPTRSLLPVSLPVDGAYSNLATQFGVKIRDSPANDWTFWKFMLSEIGCHTNWLVTFSTASICTHEYEANEPFRRPISHSPLSSLSQRKDINCDEFLCYVRKNVDLYVQYRLILS